MAGRAFFYSPRSRLGARRKKRTRLCLATARRKSAATCGPERPQVRASDFPVEEGLPDPKAIAEPNRSGSMGADRGAVSRARSGRCAGAGRAQTRQLPPIATQLVRRPRRRKGRSSRLEAVDCTGGEQRILITGESGAGKSALIANWIHPPQPEPSR